MALVEVTERHLRIVELTIAIEVPLLLRGRERLTRLESTEFLGRLLAIGWFFVIDGCGEGDSGAVAGEEFVAHVVGFGGVGRHDLMMSVGGGARRSRWKSVRAGESSFVFSNDKSEYYETR